jgi:hypothetical protein
VFAISGSATSRREAAADTIERLAAGGKSLGSLPFRAPKQG